MKITNIAKMAMLVPAFSMALATPALAHRIVHVEGTLYVIICDNNGGNFTFSGSQQGAGDVAGIICPTMSTNGTVGTGTATANTFEPSRPAQAALREKGKGATISKDCPKGTHWYEPAKACVANGGHPN